ncbi:MAG: hypothetical protein GY699_06985 [Desulfobacteraceae bacterium]|nr:hypothetical protein [Desulfobacteraceae bacterium]
MVIDDEKITYSDWSFTNEIEIDYSKKDICQLCGHKGLKYKYYIRHKTNRDLMIVGSSCILKFSDIIIYSKDGKLISDEKLREKALKDSLNEHLREAALSSLRELYKIKELEIRHLKDYFTDYDNRLNIPRPSQGEREEYQFFKDFESSIISTKENKKLSFEPLFLTQVFKAFHTHGVLYESLAFHISLRTLSAQIDLKGLVKNGSSDFELIKPCLSPTQYKKYVIDSSCHSIIRN